MITSSRWNSGTTRKHDHPLQNSFYHYLKNDRVNYFREAGFLASLALESIDESVLPFMEPLPEICHIPAQQCQGALPTAHQGLK